MQIGGLTIFRTNKSLKQQKESYEKGIICID